MEPVPPRSGADGSTAWASGDGNSEMKNYTRKGLYASQTVAIHDIYRRAGKHLETELKNKQAQTTEYCDMFIHSHTIDYASNSLP